MGALSEQDVARYVAARLWPAHDLSRLADEEDADPLLLRAIYLLETEFRPRWFRVVEWAYVAVRLLACAAGVAIRDVTVGEFQVRLSRVLQAHGLAYVQRGPDALSVDWRDVCAAYRLLASRSAGRTGAARHIARLWQRTSGGRSQRIMAVGTVYNGSASYGRLLAVVEAELRRAKQGGVSGV